jgi:hypothetical protein
MAEVQQLFCTLSNRKYRHLVVKDVKIKAKNLSF